MNNFFYTTLPLIFICGFPITMAWLYFTFTTFLEEDPNKERRAKPKSAVFWNENDVHEFLKKS